MHTGETGSLTKPRLDWQQALKTFYLHSPHGSFTGTCGHACLVYVSVCMSVGTHREDGHLTPKAGVTGDVRLLMPELGPEE